MKAMTLIYCNPSVPLHAVVLAVLVGWRAESANKSDEDFLFPSIRKNGTQPITPDMVLKRSIRPALARAGVTGKVIGWHSILWRRILAAWEWM